MINISDLVERFHQALDMVPGAMNLWKEGISCETHTGLPVLLAITFDILLSIVLRCERAVR